MSRESFSFLHNILSEVIDETSLKVPLDKQILAFIWLLATPDSYRSVGCRFDLSKSTLWNCFYRILKAIINIADRIIKWPTDQEKEIIKAHYATKRMIGKLPIILKK